MDTVELKELQATLARAVFLELKEFLDTQDLVGSQGIAACLDIAEKAVSAVFPDSRVLKEILVTQVYQALVEFLDIRASKGQVVTQESVVFPDILESLVTQVYRVLVELPVILESLVTQGSKVYQVTLVNRDIRE